MLAWWLHQRRAAGWGRSVEELRLRRDIYLSAAGPILGAFLVFIVGLSIAKGHHFSLHSLVNLAVYYLPFISLFAGIAFILIINYALRLRRGETMGTMIVWGKIFTVIPDLPYSLYIQIGATKEVAKWYVLDAMAEQAVTGAVAQESTFELDVLRGTGFILRLRRSGKNPLDLDFVAAHSLAFVQERPTDSNVTANEAELYPSIEQSRELHRYTRSRTEYWGVKSAAIGVNAFVLTCGGSLLFLSAGVLLVLNIFTVNLLFHGTIQERIAFEVMFSIFFITGVLVMIFGIRLIPHWLVARRARNEPTAIIEGKVLSWINWGSNHNKQETIIKLKEESGQTHIFRIPYQFYLRAQQMGAMLSITYYPTTERVVHVTDINELKQI